MIKTIIIDDEQLARENLKETLKQHFPFIEIVGEAEGVETGIAVIQANAPQLVFMDLDLTDGSAFNILEELGRVDFHVIFVTAYDEYAVKAFQCNALDYVLKPMDLENLKRAVGKVNSGEFAGYDFTQILKNIKQDVGKRSNP